MLTLIPLPKNDVRTFRFYKNTGHNKKDSISFFEYIKTFCGLCHLNSELSLNPFSQCYTLNVLFTRMMTSSLKH